VHESVAACDIGPHLARSFRSLLPLSPRCASARWRPLPSFFGRGREHPTSARRLAGRGTARCLPDAGLSSPCTVNQYKSSTRFEFAKENIPVNPNQANIACNLTCVIQITGTR